MKKLPFEVKQVNLRLPKELYERIQKAAELEHRSATMEIIEMLTFQIINKEKWLEKKHLTTEVPAVPDNESIQKLVEIARTPWLEK